MPSAYALTRQTFNGQYSYMDDPSTATTEGFGLMYYGARMYDPALGRFTSADSIVPAGVQGLDRYAYTFNNPVKYTDPTGHTAWQNDGGGPGSCDLDCIRARRQGDDDPNPDWHSGRYGCASCHYAKSLGKSILTDSELAAANQNFIEWMAVGEGPILASVVVVGGASVAPEVTYAAGVTCLSSPACVTVTGAAGGAGTTAYREIDTIGGVRVLSGDENLTAVIGRNMDDRVVPFAKAIGAETWTGYDPNLTNLENYYNDQIWSEGLVAKNYTVYDIGLDPKFGDYLGDIYYGIETRVIFGDPFTP